MYEIQLFSNESFGSIRTTTDESGNILFCGKDIATALGYVDTAQAIRKHCKGVVDITTPSNGGNQTMKFISEGDVYRLTFSSKLPNAEMFTGWVVDEILPSIRKHGAYMTEHTLDQLLNDPDLVIGLATQLKEERAKVKAEKERNEQLTATNAQLDLQNKQQAHEIDQLRPIAAYAQIVLSAPGLMTINQIAKDYGKSAVWMNRMLSGLGVQYKQNDQWLLYSKYAGYGYTHTRLIEINKPNGVRDMKPFTMWTQKGRMFIYELLKKNGIVPMIEQS